MKTDERFRLAHLWPTLGSHRGGGRPFANCRGYPSSWFASNEETPARALSLYA